MGRATKESAWGAGNVPYLDWAGIEQVCTYVQVYGTLQVRFVHLI